MNKSILFLTFTVCCYASLSLGSTSSSKASGDYIVSPPDNNPSIGYDDGPTSLVSLMEYLTSQGYSTLSYSKYKYSDKNLYSKSGYIGQKFGYYQSNGDFVPAPEKPTIEDARVVNDGVYKLNKDALVRAIGNGEFSNKVLLYRLLVEEFFFGQLIVSASPFSTKSNKLTDNKVVLELTDNGVVLKEKKSWQTTLKQIRFIRNAIEPTHSSSPITNGKSSCFSPVDFFVGIILINNSSAVFKTGKIAIKAGDVDFLPIDSSSVMNKWNSVDNSSGLPTRQPMKLKGIGGKKHSFNLQILKESNTVGINFAGTDYIPSISSSGSSSKKRCFSTTMMKNFFQDVGPWALIVEVGDGKDPELKGLGKMSFADYGKYLKVNTKNTSTFTLPDIFDAPYNAYKKSYLIKKHKKTERVKITKKYPLECWIAQGLFNGILETSTYRTLAGSKTNKPISFDNVVLNESRQSPSFAQVLGYRSGNDFLFLRALQITKALLHMSGISSKLLTTNNAKGKSLFLQALAQPTKNITTKGKTVYIGASSGRGSNVYLPILPVLRCQAPIRRRGRSSQNRSSNAAIDAYQKGYKAGLSSGSKGTPTQTGSGAVQNTTRKKGRRSQNRSSNAAIDAYKKGYKAGLSSGSKGTSKR